MVPRLSLLLSQSYMPQSSVTLLIPAVAPGLVSVTCHWYSNLTCMVFPSAVRMTVIHNTWEVSPEMPDSFSTCAQAMRVAGALLGVRGTVSRPRMFLTRCMVLWVPRVPNIILRSCVLRLTVDVSHNSLSARQSLLLYLTTVTTSVSAANFITQDFIQAVV